jgi:acetyl-CoA acyltransferase
MTPGPIWQDERQWRCYAIGHPLGASGARIMTTLVNTLEQRGGRYGLQTMCEGGGGMANATIIERLG